MICGYLAHRLSVAGYSGPNVFDKKICRKIFKASGGVPRLVNILAHKCLLLAYGEGTSKVTASHLKKAVADTESISINGRFWHRMWLGVLGMTATTAAVAGLYLLMGVRL